MALMLNIISIIIGFFTFTIAQLEQSNNLMNCIPSEIVFVCIRLNSVTDLSYTASQRIYASLSLSYIDPFTSYQSTQYITSKTTTSTIVDNIDLIVCVPTLQTDIISVKQYSVTFKNRDDNDRTIGTLSIDDLTNNNQFDITTIGLNESPLDITLDDTSYFTSSLIISSVDISLSLWISDRQCVQVEYGHMFAEDHYMLSLELSRPSGDNIIFASQATMSNYGSASWNDAYICLPQSPSRFDEIISGDFKLYSTTEFTGSISSDIEYEIMAINNNNEDNAYQPCQYINGTDTTINFEIGDVSVLYLPTCDYIGYECESSDASLLNSVTVNINKLDVGILIFVLILLFIGGILLAIANYTSSNIWKSSDPVKYDHIIFFIVFLWTSVSQFAFIAYLFGSIETYKTEHILSNIFYGCLVLFIVSYIFNIIALTHYLQIWNHAFAPGVSRHWLQYWSWFLIMICVLFGNVNIALELCNCLVIPTVDIFAMHLPHSELVNCRINRFWTNSLSLDLPFFIIICIFLGSINTKIITLNRFIIWNTLIISFISFITTVIFAYSRKSYSSKNPIALYRFSFTFNSVAFESYFIHSHQRIKQSFAELIQLRKPSLVIIDQSSEILECMKVEGRILKDTKKDLNWDDTQWRALQNIQRNSERLKKLLAAQFGLLENKVTVENFQFVRMREIDGQLVYDYETAVKRCVECQNCYHIKNQSNENNT